MFTEDQAKKRQCCGPPIVASMSLIAPSVAENGAALEDLVAKQSLCSGAQCMAWRWAQKPNPDWKPDHGMMYPPPDRRLDPQPYIEDRERGYCGLAGRP
jgi:hypothetical protein